MATKYTQIIFKTPEARVAYSEAALEVKAEKVVKIYEGLRVDANDGEFAFWSEDDLVVALHDLSDEVRWLAEARRALDVP